MVFCQFINKYAAYVNDVLLFYLDASIRSQVEEFDYGGDDFGEDGIQYCCVEFFLMPLS